MIKTGKWSVEAHEERVKEKRQKIRLMEALLFTYEKMGRGHVGYARDLRKPLRSVKVQLQGMTGSQI